MDNNSKKMTMNYEFVSPDLAAMLLESNTENRKISKGTVQAYANDIIAGNWDEATGESISIDENGVLRDGQHRCAAIVLADKGIHIWVCRHVASDGIYDNNRKRSTSDQVAIMRSDFDNVYKSTRYISVAKALIMNTGRKVGARTVTPKELIDFTEAHKEDLDGFFLNMPQATVPKISIGTVYLSLYMAYMDGVDIEDILSYYDILCSGMSTRPEEFPIIAYRNYLKDVSLRQVNNSEEIKRCQYSLKKYLSGSCVKRSLSPRDFVYPFPYMEEATNGTN